MRTQGDLSRSYRKGDHGLGLCVLAILAWPGCAVQPSSLPINRSSEVYFHMQVRQDVADLGYEPHTADDLLTWVQTWRAGRGMEILEGWAADLASARQTHSAGATSARDLAQTECRIAEQLLEQVRRPLRYDVHTFDLGDILATGQAQCLGMVQVYWILARAIGLAPVPLDVLATHADHPLPQGQTHMGCALALADRATLVLDVVSGQVYGPCVLADLYSGQGPCLSLRDRVPCAPPYRRIRLLEASGLRAHLANARASQRVAAGRLQQALGLYAEAIHDLPDLALTWGNRAATLYKLGQMDRAIALDPDSAWPLNTRASAYVRIGRLEQALADLDRAADLDDPSATTFYNRGNVNAKLNHLHEAVRDYTRAIALAPSWAHAHFGLGNALHRLGRYGDAVRCYTRAIQLDPSLSSAYTNRSLSYAMLGRHKDTHQDQIAAAEAQPSLSDP